ncbi:zinc-binding dehydrogenase [Nocardia sp. NPDC052566]|uniref:zinc-binding dehydrogenase n=1 Tax=Nocardia sp. NPDC052566 TaxID=3364330 RepID=UPI0037C6AD3A
MSDGFALRREPFDLGALGDEEVLVEPLLGSWEANIDHALARSPIDVCSSRREKKVVLGNLGVVRVLEPGRAVTTLREGDLCLLMPFGKCDRYGYAELAYAYDAPGTIGLLAKRSKIPARVLLPMPEDTPYSLRQWATYGRYFTAWDNWRKAFGCWRTQIPDDDPADHLVFGWGGGVSFAELLLAKEAGFKVAMAVGSDARIEFLRKHGIEPVDRRTFPDLAVPDKRDPGFPARHRASMREFLTRIGELSGGAGAAIIVDNIGAPVFAATLKALGRQGVIATCGWKAGMRMTTLRGAECISRHIHVHTHVWNLGDSPRIRDLQEGAGWIPPEDATVVYDFDDVPNLYADYAAGRVESYFPLYQVNPL